MAGNPARMVMGGGRQVRPGRVPYGEERGRGGRGMGRQMKRGAAAVGLDRLQAPETLPLSDGELCSLILNIPDSAIAGARALGGVLFAVP